MRADLEDRELRGVDWFLRCAPQPGPHVQLGAIPHSIWPGSGGGLRNGEYVIKGGNRETS